MGFKLARPSHSFLLPGTFLKRFEFSDDIERRYVRQVAKQATKRRTHVHVLAGDDNTPVGFVALSVSLLADQPCIVIDYLFTSFPYRKLILDELGSRVSEYLLNFAITSALEINEKVPITYVALTAGHENLIPFYSDWGFRTLDKTGWMFLRI